MKRKSRLRRFCRKASEFTSRDDLEFVILEEVFDDAFATAFSDGP